MRTMVKTMTTNILTESLINMLDQKAYLGTISRIERAYLVSEVACTKAIYAEEEASSLDLIILRYAKRIGESGCNQIASHGSYAAEAITSLVFLHRLKSSYGLHNTITVKKLVEDGKLAQVVNAIYFVSKDDTVKKRSEIFLIHGALIGDIFEDQEDFSQIVDLVKQVHERLEPKK